MNAKHLGGKDIQDDEMREANIELRKEESTNYESDPDSNVSFEDDRKQVKPGIQCMKRSAREPDDRMWTCYIKNSIEAQKNSMTEKLPS